MSEVNLLAFGALVSFIVVAGVYLYVREQFAHEQRKTVEVRDDRNQPHLVRDRDIG